MAEREEGELPYHSEFERNQHRLDTPPRTHTQPRILYPTQHSIVTLGPSFHRVPHKLCPISSLLQLLIVLTCNG